MKYLTLIIITILLNTCSMVQIKKQPCPICTFSMQKIDDNNFRINKIELSELMTSYLLYYDGEQCIKQQKQ
jgi:hypothetical protein